MTTAIVQDKKNENELTTGNSPAEMIRHAVASGADLDKMKGLLELQKEWEANEARKAYHEAMAMFAANAPEIDKDKEVSFGTTKFSHATLGNVTRKIRHELSKWGLSASWGTSQNGGQISVTCKITHKKGHSEQTTLSAAADTSGSKNAIQAIGSAITYLERYTLLALTGLATSDQDDDGQSVGTEFVDKKELNQLLDIIADREVDIPRFLTFLKIESLEKLPKAQYQKALEAAKAKKKPVSS